MEMASSIGSVLQALLVYPSSTTTITKKLISKLSSKTTDSKALPEITLDEVSNHDSYSDCWIVVYDRVYDVTNFLQSHPGGENIIMDHAGRDATLAFHDTTHSQLAIEQMGRFLIGELPIKQRIFRTSNTCTAVFLSGIPD